MDNVAFDPIGDISKAFNTREAEEANKSTDLGREDFLMLLIAKMENQDPMSPAEDTEFISQLATFSSLEQLISVNDNLEVLGTAQGTLINAQALSLIGKEALVEAGNELRITNGVPDTLVYALDAEARAATMNIVDAEGNVVRTLELDTSNPGRTTLEWDGKDSKGNLLPDGDYKITYSAFDAQGESVSMAVFRSLSIDGVNYLSGGISLVSGDREIPFDSILEFRAGR